MNAHAIIRVSVALLGLALSSSASRLEAQHTAPVSRSIALGQDQRIAISVHWGEVTLIGHEGTALEFEARPQAGPAREGLRSVGEFEGDPAVLVDESPREIRLRTPEPESGTFSAVDLVVRVPRAARLHVEMLRGGEVLVDGVEGELEISSQNGSVEMRGIRGSASVDASNGSIAAEFESVRPDAPMSFVSMNGSVVLTLPETTSADLRVRTTGDEIRTDFDLVPIPRAGGEDAATAAGRSRHLDARINGGGPLFLVTTFNGEIILRGAPR